VNKDAWMVNDTDALYFLLCTFPSDAACLYQTFLLLLMLCCTILSLSRFKELTH